MSEFDLFGNEIIKNELLRDKFIEPPFSILDSKTKNWRKRVNLWKRLGIKSELGRESDNKVAFSKYLQKDKLGHSCHTGVSVFDPALCELLYKWFCPDNGKILDPFAGGSVRGIVANYLDYKYTGIDIRIEQIEANINQAKNIIPDKIPDWIVGDSDKILNNLNEKFDFIFSCPPYSDLEIYSNLDGDISNMSYSDFLKSYNSIIKKSCDKLKKGGYACFVVGEFRDKKGNYIGFVPDTIKAFQNSGISFYNECIYLQGLAGACLVAGSQMEKSKKVRKIHQNVLIFKKC